MEVKNPKIRWTSNYGSGTYLKDIFLDSFPKHKLIKGKSMSTVNQDIQKSLRVVLPLDLYDKVKAACPEHGQISQLIRALLSKYLSQVMESENESH